MRRLTPDKCFGFSLPRTMERINRGNTSIIYSPAPDAGTLEVYTIELLKAEWWTRSTGLKIAEDYQEVGYAHYTGYSGVYCQFKRIDLPVYHLTARRLDSPGGAQMTRIRSIQRRIRAVLNTVPYHRNNRKSYVLDLWRALEDNAADQFDEIAPCIDFVMDYDAENIYPDFGAGDFMIDQGQIVCIDPFHHVDSQSALQLHD